MDKIIMSRKEMEQVSIFEQLKNRKLTQASASELLGLSERQVRSKLQRYKNEGPISLVHKNRGRPSKKKWDPNEEKLALDLLKSEWEGFGPTFAAEKLKEIHDIKVSAETMRCSMIRANLWIPKQSRKKHRKRRQRKSVFGTVIQFDGSDHAWFEDRAPKCTLLVLIDDATSKIVWLEFVKSESLNSCLVAVKNYLTRYGRPHSFYVDYGKVFSVNTHNPDRDKMTQFERAMKELDIEVIHAHSPQAKGRVERSNGTLQDRLIKELRIRDIKGIEEANRFSQNEYIQIHNQKFAIKAYQEGDAHRSIEGFNLETILCRQEERKLQNDYVILYKKRVLQLEKQQSTIIRPKEIITVYEKLDGIIELSIRKVKLNFHEIKHRPANSILEKKYNNLRPRRVSEASRRWNGSFIRHNASATPL